MEKHKIGVIGCGGIAEGKHLPALVKQPNIEIAWLCDILPERAEALKEKFGLTGAKVCRDYKEVLADPSVDAVHVLTPNREHWFITVDALNAGKHVLCEKPMAKSSAEAKAMLDAARVNNKVLTIGYQNRQRPDALYLKKLIEQGELGEIYYARALALRRRAVPTWGVFLDADAQGGGPLIDIGTHALDLCLWFMDNYDVDYVVGNSYRKLGDREHAANNFGSWDPKKFTVEDSCFGFITMKNGATISLETSWAINIRNYKEAAVVLAGTEGGADMFDGLHINGERNSRLYTWKPDLERGGVDYFVGQAPEVPADRECKDFYRAIEEGTRPLVLAEQAYMVTRVLEAIYESAKTKKPVYL